MKIIQYSENENSINIQISGPIDEKSETPLNELISKAKSGVSIVLDIKEISSVNSMGAKYWVRFMEKWPEESTLILDNCPPVFIDYCNLLDGFCTAAEIRSLQVPLSCNHCGQRKMKILTAAECDNLQNFSSEPCIHCKSLLAPEVDAEEYLFFIQK